jgi:hypothetical protein
MTTMKCEHPSWTDWNFTGFKQVMQVRSCWECGLCQTRKDPALLKSNRCTHEQAKVLNWEEANCISLKCSCGLLWSGLPYNWKSRRGIKHQPPKWVQRFIDACKVGGMDSVNFKTSEGGNAP